MAEHKENPQKAEKERTVVMEPGSRKNNTRKEGGTEVCGRSE